RTDIYALGVTLFEMVTGRPPFRAPSAFELILKHHSELPPKASSFAPELPPALDALVAKALEKDPAHRYQTAAEMAAALRSLGGLPQGEGAAFGAIAEPREGQG